jgi:hypothetical protein
MDPPIRSTSTALFGKVEMKFLITGADIPGSMPRNTGAETDSPPIYE